VTVARRGRVVHVVLVGELDRDPAPLLLDADHRVDHVGIEVGASLGDDRPDDLRVRKAPLYTRALARAS
jgi:hypothetical protein